MRFKVPRELIPWNPTVNHEKCIGCRTCFEFCSHGVYSWDEEAGKLVVSNPTNCVVGCSGCRSQCPAEAISFPPLSILRNYM